MTRPPMHNLPAFAVFHDATLDEVAQISGVGAKKLEAYGAEILRVLEGVEAG